MTGVDNLIEHLDFLARNLKDYDENYILRILLLEIGVPTHGYGFDYVEAAVMMWYSGSMRRVSKEIYPNIAKKYGIYTTVSQVEKTIRSTIIRSWRDRDEMWDTFFHSSKRPTNAEFISRLAKILEMWHDRRELLRQKEGGYTEWNLH